MARKILYAEDDADDRQFLGDVIKVIDESVELIFAENGMKAMETLETLKINSELPCAIILDMNMPYLNGKQTLSKIQADPQLNSLSVFVFTSSSNPNDKRYFENAGVEMITKPSSPEEFRKVARHMLLQCLV